MKIPAETVRVRTVAHIQYWIEHNTYGMGEHDLSVLRTAVALLNGERPTECPVPLPREPAPECTCPIKDIPGRYEGRNPNCPKHGGGSTPDPESQDHR